MSWDSVNPAVAINWRRAEVEKALCPLAVDRGVMRGSQRAERAALLMKVGIVEAQTKVQKA